jgi:hypothetical protein
MREVHQTAIEKDNKPADCTREALRADRRTALWEKWAVENSASGGCPVGYKGAKGVLLGRNLEVFQCKAFKLIEMIFFIKYERSVRTFYELFVLYFYQID